MKRFAIWLISLFFRIIFWFRYSVSVKGLEKLNKNTLNKKGGVIFLPNHPAVFVDPTLVTLYAGKKFPIRPMIVEYFYHHPFIKPLMKLVNALPIPNFETSSNSLKRKKSEKVIQTVIDDIKKGDNFLIYPAGRTKQTNREIVGGASAVQRIIKEAPETNIVLVRTKGLWGSSFSRALTGKAPSLFPTLLKNLKYVLKNGIFFTPRRKVILEFEPAPEDFPYGASRLEMNQWLEEWYNRPDGLSHQEGKQPGDSLIFVSYSAWKEELPDLYEGDDSSEEGIDLSLVPEETKEKIFAEIAKIAMIEKEKVQEGLNLNTDLGMDSLDVADLGLFIHDKFDVQAVPPTELTTVAKALAIATKQIVYEGEQASIGHLDFAKWNVPIQRVRKQLAPGSTIPEVFLNNCSRMGSAIACGDERAGMLTYKDLKLRIILLAEYIRTLPGQYIGVLLPSSVAAYAVILACQLAGKVPTLINWTMGSRHLQAVKQLSNVQCVLTSMLFIDRLQNVDLSGIEEELIMLEEVKDQFSVKDKLSAFIRSKLSTAAILKHFEADRLTKEDIAVLLFTSGTESLPKGVPLSYYNILSNQRQAFETVDLYSSDVMFGILPPFHAFGFTVSGLMALLSGIKIVYTPDPTDGKKLAETIRDWHVSVMCGAPTFLKSMFKGGKPGYFDTLRLCVTGAEKAPPELFRLAEEMGAEGAVYEGYGITECSPILTINKPGEVQSGVGAPLKDIELKVVHPETFEPVQEMGRGLVLARGPNIFSGYINPDVASPFVTINGDKWYKTGDLGHLDDRNHLIISGRQKRFVKIGGEMVSLASIEGALLEAATNKGWPISEDGPSIAVCAKEDIGDKTRIFVFTTFSTSVDEVNDTLRGAGFSTLVRVASVFQLEEIPIMGSGKIFYRELESAYLA